MALVVAGNWKMHLSPSEALGYLPDFARELPADPGSLGVEVVVFPPALSLAAVRSSPDRPSWLRVGVQNIHSEAAGAFTGETSAPMAKDAGATHVLIGHSERRHLFGETDEEARAKMRAALDEGLVPVLCLGETLRQRRDGQLEEVIRRQLAGGLDDLPAAPREIMVAYEPVWAIGTGETATPADASAAHQILREELEDLLGNAEADAVPILYGGSVKPANALELMDAPQVDGVLVGGASLDPRSFAEIVRAGIECARAGTFEAESG